MKNDRSIDLGLTGYEELFKSTEERLDAKKPKVEAIPLAALTPFRNHPFKVKEDEEMAQLMRSIADAGVLSPALARPLPDGGYELISGHRRLAACKALGMDTMPVIIRDLTDEEAVITMVDSNLQREHILPSEKAFAYKMKMEALSHQGMQMQTFVTQPDDAVEGFDGYNGDLTGDVAATLGVNCGMSTGRNGVMAFAANQRDEVRDLHDVAGALGAQPGMKQQTFVASGVVTKGNGDCFLSEERHTALTAGGGLAGQGCVLTAAFSAGQGSKAGGIGYQEECSPTLKAAESGTNMVPSVLCLNDQGGSMMDCSENVSGTLRAQEHGHQPLVFDNHGQDSRFRGPVQTAQTVSSFFGMGGNNTSLVEQEADAICITGNTVDRQPQNGGNGLGCQDELAYTLTATDRHCIYARQRVDEFKDGEVVSTQSARQHKDATDLVVDVAGLDCRNAVENGDLCGTLQKGTSGSSLNSIHPIRNGLLIRRLTPLECERLQGFPDGWTDIPGASDSARYKALGNSVAIPCVEFIMSRIAAALL